MDGVLVIDKPAGVTSHDVVSRARRVLGTRRIGYVGTLDPMATGVLPLVIGHATRLASLLSVGPKIYTGTIHLGMATNTYDATGEVQNTSQSADNQHVPSPDALEISQKLQLFVGTFVQHPPPFSAKKINGVRAYRLARQNKPVTPKAVTVTVHSIDIISITDNCLRCRVNCEPGFYMRSLAHDLGQALNCGGHLKELRREQSGAFTLMDALTVDALEEVSCQPTRKTIPLACLLPDMPKAILNAQGLKKATHGNNVTLGDVLIKEGSWQAFDADELSTQIKLFDSEGTFVAIAAVESDSILHPEIVLV